MAIDTSPTAIDITQRGRKAMVAMDQQFSKMRGNISYIFNTTK